METGTAALIIEFTESAAERFVDLLARLDASLEPTPGARALFPSALSVSVAGEAFAPLEMTTYPVFPDGRGRRGVHGGAWRCVQHPAYWGHHGLRLEPGRDRDRSG